MTKAEMTRIFAAMSLIYRHDKMFSAGIDALKPTIEIWTAALPDLSFNLGQAALMKVFRTSRFPPTPAELSEAAAEIILEMNSQCNLLKERIRVSTAFGGSVESYYASLPESEITRLVIDRMGGPEKLYSKLELGGQIWNWTAFENAHRDLWLNGGAALPETKDYALPPKKG